MSSSEIKEALAREARQNFSAGGPIEACMLRCCLLEMALQLALTRESTEKYGWQRGR